MKRSFRVITPLRLCWKISTAAAVFLIVASRLFSQEPKSAEATPSPTPVERQGVSEEDPTKPILLSVRDEYRSFKGDGWANTLILRVDRLVMKNFGVKGGARGLLLRFDVPFNTVHRGSVTESGLGDLYGQALYIPRLRKMQLIAIGTGIVVPTATARFLGQGKLILAPTVVPLWYFAKRERFFFIRTQNYVSIAGDESRPNVNYLVVDPTFVHRVSEKWWLSEDTEFKWDWRNKLSSGISGMQIGRMVRGHFGFWFKPEIPWGPGRISDFNLKFTVFRLR